MFAKHELGAACLIAFGQVQAGAIVPECNELYSDVELWLKTNEWGDLPDDFGKVELTKDEAIAAREEEYANPATGSDRLFINYHAAIAKEADQETIELRKSEWLARREEIKLSIPLPSE